MRRYIKFIKEAGSKLVILKLEVSEDCKVERFSIEGEFFAANPDPIDELANYTRGMELSIDVLVPKVMAAISEARIMGADATIIKRELEILVKEVLRGCVAQ